VVFDFSVDVFKFMVDGLYFFIIEIDVFDVFAVILVVGFGQFGEDGFFALRHWLYVWMQSEDSRVMLGDLFNHPVNVANIYLTESDGLDELTLQIGVQNVGSDEGVKQ